MKNLSIRTLLTTAAFVASVVAVSKPVFSETNNLQFTSCLTPNGQVIASYEDGIHGIPGVGSKIGKDIVYSAELGAMQCFCGSNGEGIQTNWKKASNLTEDEIKVHVSQGWIYIPTGAAWGLANEPYLAFNSNYSCNSTTTSGGGDGKTDGKTDGRTDGRTDGMGSIVQSSTGSKLASTGNVLFIAEIFTLGVILTITGLILRIKTDRN